jgi:hypothetical protein
MEGVILSSGFVHLRKILLPCSSIGIAVLASGQLRSALDVLLAGQFQILGQSCQFKEE